MREDGFSEEEDFLAYMSNSEEDEIVNDDISDAFDQLDPDDCFECPYCHEQIDSADIIWIEPDEGLVECPICSAQFNCGISQY